MTALAMNSRLRVLVVEDDAVLCEMLCENLESEYTVSPAHSCAEALAKMKQQPADVAILDYNLPDGTGLSLMPQLRSLRPHLRSILMSGNLSEATGDPNFQSAAVGGRLSKPFTCERLRYAIKELLGSSTGR